MATTSGNKPNPRFIVHLETDYRADDPSGRKALNFGLRSLRRTGVRVLSVDCDDGRDPKRDAAHHATTGGNEASNGSTIRCNTTTNPSRKGF